MKNLIMLFIFSLSIAFMPAATMAEEITAAAIEEAVEGAEEAAEETAEEVAEAVEEAAAEADEVVDDSDETL